MCWRLEAAQAGAAHGSVWVADEQTAGRGRSGHSWHSAAGDGLYVSVLLRPQMALVDALWLSLATGLAAQAAIATVTGLDARYPLAQRSFDRQQKVRRHPGGDLRRRPATGRTSDAALRRHRRWHQCESPEFPCRTGSPCHLSAARKRKTMGARADPHRISPRAG